MSYICPSWSLHNSCHWFELRKREGFLGFYCFRKKFQSSSRLWKKYVSHQRWFPFLCLSSYDNKQLNNLLQLYSNSWNQERSPPDRASQLGLSRERSAKNLLKIKRPARKIKLKQESTFSRLSPCFSKDLSLTKSKKKEQTLISQLLFMILSKIICLSLTLFQKVNFKNIPAVCNSKETLNL